MTKPNFERNFIREWRNERRYSLDHVAAETGIDKGNLSKVERGINPWNQQMLVSLAKLLNVDVVDLLARGPDVSQPVYRTYSKAPPAVRRMIDAAAEAIVMAAKSETQPTGES